MEACLRHGHGQGNHDYSQQAECHLHALYGGLILALQQIDKSSVMLHQMAHNAIPPSALLVLVKPLEEGI